MIEPHLLPLFQKGFAKTSEVLLGRLFSEVWIDRGGTYSVEKGWPSAKPLFLYSTHSSWWDPIAAAFLAVAQMKRRTLAPMDEREFKRYKSLRFAGVFGVSQGDGEKVQAILEKELQDDPSTAVWVTPQGQFSPNELPQPEFKGGLSRWALRFSGAACVPVSVHYHFGHLPRPFVFFRVGKESAYPQEKDGTEDERRKFNETLRLRLESETKELLHNVWKGQTQMNFVNGFERVA